MIAPIYRKEQFNAPIIGKLYLAYISNPQVIGLPKINRLVKYYAKQPQVQERLTNQIAVGLMEALESNDVAIIIEAVPLCVSSGGIKDSLHQFYQILNINS